MEENLRPEESLVADFDVKVLLGDGVCAGVLLDVFVRILVKLAELLGDVWTHVAVPADRNERLRLKQ